MKTCGDRVVSAIEDLQQQLKDVVEMNKAEIMRIEAAYEAKLAACEARAKEEAARLAKLETALTKAQQKNDEDRQEFFKQLQHMAHNLQLAVVARDVVETKLEQTNEKKKILVAEVKRLRAKIDSSDEKMKKLKSFTKQMYDQALTPPKDKNGKPIIKLLYPDSMGGTPTESAVNSARFNESPREVIDTSETTAVTEVGSEHGGSAHTTGDSKDEPINREDEESGQDHGRHHSRTSSTSDADGWDLPPVRLKELGWLSAEQEALVETRVKREQVKAENESTASRLSRGMLSGAAGRSASFSLSQPGSFFSSSSDTSNTPPSLPQENEDKGLSVKLVNSLKASGAAMNSSLKASGAAMNSSLKASGAVVSSVGAKTSNMFSSVLAASAAESSGLLDSMLSKITPRSNTSGQNTQREEPTPDAEKEKNKEQVESAQKAELVDSFFEAPATTTSLEEAEKLRATQEKEREATKVACLRCGGTVEGPKHSTCKCRVPALTEADLKTPEESSGALESTKKLFGGMIRTLSNHL